MQTSFFMATKMRTPIGGNCPARKQIERTNQNTSDLKWAEFGGKWFFGKAEVEDKSKQIGWRRVARCTQIENIMCTS